MSILLSLHDPDKTSITFGKKKYQVPHYSPFQTENKKMTDARRVVRTFSKTESWFYWEMDIKKDTTTNEVIFSRKDCPKENLAYYTEVISNLINKNIIIRIKQNHYLMTPYLMMPQFEFYDIVVAKWLSLGGKVPTV